MELERDLLPVDKAEGDAIQKEIVASGAKPKARVLDNASAVEKAPDSNVANPACADPNVVSDGKTPSAEARSDKALGSPANVSAAGDANTLVAVEAVKSKSEVGREMNATPTGRSRPTDNKPSASGENLHIDDPDA
jgi:hypothetical protein